MFQLWPIMTSHPPKISLGRVISMTGENVPFKVDGAGLADLGGLELENLQELAFSCTSVYPVEWEFECPEVNSIYWSKISPYIDSGMYVTMLLYRNHGAFLQSWGSAKFVASVEFLYNSTCRLIGLPGVKTSIVFTNYGQGETLGIHITTKSLFNSSPICAVYRNGTCPLTMQVNLEPASFNCKSHKTNRTTTIKQKRSCLGQLSYCMSLVSHRRSQECINFGNDGRTLEAEIIPSKSYDPILLQCVDFKGNWEYTFVYRVNTFHGKNMVVRPEVLAEQTGAISLSIINHSGKEVNFYHDGETARIQCMVQSSIFYTGSILSITFVNGSTATLPSLGTETTEEEWTNRTLSIKMAVNMSSVICNCSILGSMSWAHAARDVDVISTSMPIIRSRMGENDCETWFECNATGVPPPIIKWQNRPSSSFLLEGGKEPCMEGLESWESVDQGRTWSFSRLSLSSNITPSESPDKLFELCEAENEVGMASFPFMLPDAENPDTTATTVVGLIIATSVFVGLLYFAVRWFLFDKRLLKLSQEEIDEFFNGNKHVGNDDVMAMPFDTRFEIPTEDLDTNSSSMLGSGEFSHVITGRIKSSLVPVAVKISKSSADSGIFKASLMEVKIMIHIGRHPNIVELIGVNTSGIINRKLLICMEYCSLGNLKNYLKTHKPVSQMRDEGNLETGTCPTFLQLMKWIGGIAMGMEYLASKLVVHADLAARNVLLDANLRAKVSDFGLSRQLFEAQEYRKKTKVPLPWRWMAIESLNSYTFSSKSDIWSFGVVLYEIFSDGQTPFANQDWDAGFILRLESGIHLTQPTNMSDDIFKMMQDCCNLDPIARPDFGILKRQFLPYLDTLDTDYGRNTSSSVE